MKNVKTKRRIATLCIIALGVSFESQAKDIVTALVDGMIISGDENILQHIEVRAKSFGPGLCETHISFIGETVAIAAPPHKWSDWKQLGPAISGTSEKIGFRSVCETGSNGQVRYTPQK